MIRIGFGGGGIGVCRLAGVRVLVAFFGTLRDGFAVRAATTLRFAGALRRATLRDAGVAALAAGFVVAFANAFLDPFAGGLTAAAGAATAGAALVPGSIAGGVTTAVRVTGLTFPESGRETTTGGTVNGAGAAVATSPAATIVTPPAESPEVTPARRRVTESGASLPLWNRPSMNGLAMQS